MIEDYRPIRAFIAIQIPDRVKVPLRDVQEKLLKSGIDAAFPNPETLHLTLKFLGNIRPEILHSLETNMKKAVAGIQPFGLFASGIGVFPSVKQTRIIWSGIKGEAGSLEKLAGGLDAILFKEMGIKKEEKRFTAHLTLARIKKRVLPEAVIRIIKDFEHFQTPAFSATGISLFQSELSSSGVIHQRIFFAPFPG